MATPLQTRSVPSGIVLLGIALGVYYLAVFRPLSHRAASLDGPLVGLWNRFLETNALSQAAGGVTLENSEEQWRQLEASAGKLEASAREVQARVEVFPEVRARLAEAFQLLDFQNERHVRVDQVAALAREKGVAMEPAVADGFPEYAADMPLPTLLWARLQIAHQALSAAVLCKVTSLRSLTQLPRLEHRSVLDGGTFLQELPMRIELLGSLETVNRFLVSLPLRAGELKAVGLDTLTNKPALFLDQILLRKSAPDRPNEAHLEVILSGFVPWTEARESDAARPSSEFQP